jgi:hypothetical protein
VKLDTSDLRKVAGVGRDVLEARIKMLCDALEAADMQAQRSAADLKEVTFNLTATQMRCTQLFNENRNLRGIPTEEKLHQPEEATPQDGPAQAATSPR